MGDPPVHLPQMSAATSEEDHLSELLGEALRRGPGSPEWHDAVSKLRAAGDTNANDARLLLTARERLASGREYRSVRAGPAFRQAVFEQLETPAAKPRVRLIWVAGLCSAAVLIISFATLLVLASRSGDGTDDELAQRLFISPLQQYNFLQPVGVGFDLDKIWYIDRAAGVCPTGQTESQRMDLPKPIDLSSPMCVECVINVQRVTDTRVALIVTGERPDARIEIEQNRNGFVATRYGVIDRVRREVRGGTYVLRVKLDQNQVIAEVDGKAISAGPLPMGKSATLAIEFRSVGRDTGATLVEAVRILGVAPR